MANAVAKLVCRSFGHIHASWYWNPIIGYHIILLHSSEIPKKAHRCLQFTVWTSHKFHICKCSFRYENESDQRLHPQLPLSFSFALSSSYNIFSIRNAFKIFYLVSRYVFSMRCANTIIISLHNWSVRRFVHRWCSCNLPYALCSSIRLLSIVCHQNYST